MKQYIQNTFISITMIAILCGCGFKGPLYLPKKAVVMSPAPLNSNESAVAKNKKTTASATKLSASAVKINASATKLNASTAKSNASATQ